MLQIEVRHDVILGEFECLFVAKIDLDNNSRRVIVIR